MPQELQVQQPSSQQGRKRLPWTRLSIAIIISLLCSAGAIGWILSSGRIIPDYWLYILPVLFTLLSVLIALFQWLFPFVSGEPEPSTTSSPRSTGDINIVQVPAIQPSPTSSADKDSQIQSETMSPSNTGHPEQFDVFLSYSHLDAKWVEDLAVRLEDEGGFRVWLDKWILGPGKSWQQEMARGLDQAKSSAVCISEHTPDGWFKKEIEKALNRQTKDPSFRVIPVLLPNAKTENVDDFLELNTWVDFRGPDFAYAFHRLVYGVKGLPPGRWPPK